MCLLVVVWRQDSRGGYLLSLNHFQWLIHCIMWLELLSQPSRVFSRSLPAPQMDNSFQTKCVFRHPPLIDIRVWYLFSKQVQEDQSKTSYVCCSFGLKIMLFKTNKRQQKKPKDYKPLSLTSLKYSTWSRILWDQSWLIILYRRACEYTSSFQP